MNIVFLVGNGFDLNLGLKTRFSDFYKYYHKQRAEDNRQYVRDFLDKIKRGEDWSDFELSFGKYAKGFTKETYEDYLSLWTDIHRELTEYLAVQQKDSLPKNMQNSNIDNTYLIAPDSFLNRGDRLPFDTLRGQVATNTKVDIINFNYTETFERLYGWNKSPKQISTGNKYATLNSIIHVHGLLRKNMVLGVDNESQIICTDDMKNQTRLKNRLIKPIANENTRTLREQDCAKRISEADMICIFGMSLGLTDRTWWQLIGKRLAKANARLVIFTRSTEIDDGLEYLSVELQEAKLNEFIQASGLPTDQTSVISSKISVAFNTDMFGTFSGIATAREPINGLQIIKAVE